MSTPRDTQISCPKCGKKFEVTIFRSVNTDLSPDLSEKIVSGKLFEAECPSCGFVSHLEYDLLYSDLKHSAWIWVCHPNDEAYDVNVSQIRGGLVPPGFTTRMVSDMNELREKAACLEAGVDDRVIELCKMALAMNLAAEMPEFQLKKVYYTFDGIEHGLLFYDSSWKAVRVTLDREHYEIMAELFKKLLEEEKPEPYQIIDSRWAADMFDRLDGEDQKGSGVL